MEHPTTIPMPRRRFSLLAGVLLSLLAPACGSAGLLEAQALDCAAPGGCAEGQALDGESPTDFCDDHDPCTDDVDCTPCSAVPEDKHDIYHCTADADLPPLCAGRTGCVHVALTTPAGQVDSCFPVAGTAELHAGVCRAGACVENE
jgi:hypothetical protein